MSKSVGGVKSSPQPYKPQVQSVSPYGAGNPGVSSSWAEAKSMAQDFQNQQRQMVDAGRNMAQEGSYRKQTYEAGQASQQMAHERQMAAMNTPQSIDKSKSISSKQRVSRGDPNAGQKSMMRLESNLGLRSSIRQNEWNSRESAADRNFRATESAADRANQRDLAKLDANTRLATSFMQSINQSPYNYQFWGG